MDGNVARPLHARRILVLEDDSSIALAIRDVLDAAGARVLGPVADVDAALALIDPALSAPLHDAPIDTALIDAALIDVSLHGERCFRMGDALLARGIAFAFTSGYSRATLPERFAAVPLLAKPFGPRQLLDTMQALLRR